jgi:hypothetical protein
MKTLQNLTAAERQQYERDRLAADQHRTAPMKPWDAYSVASA